ncbi:GNAT family N-acetyltransferase [Leptospira sp. 'Mane']|uniref:GNAT family N-acetyltransferase n=1 Tax=Leptospira sp. 'Mane' TaxID=3387407 RepID=UPI00398B3BA9
MIYKLSDEYFVRALQLSDLDGDYPGWFEDQEVCKYNSHGKFFYNREYFEKFIKNLNTTNQIVWAICHTSDGHIGNISLQNIEMINRNAEFAIIIGNKSHWGKGIGVLAGKELLKHGFLKLNLEKIYCGTASVNQGMIKLANQLGMQQEGIRKQHLYLEGTRVDLIEFGILRNDYKQA